MVVLALLLVASFAMAQNTAQPPAAAAAPPVQTMPAVSEPVKAPAAPPKISYVGGQLKIDAMDATLSDVLAKVAALTGVKIEVPAEVPDERMPVVELGPGPARQVLASLLSESSFDYMIQASDKDPEKIQNVLLIPKEKKGGGSSATNVAANLVRGPHGRVGAMSAPSEEAAVESPVPSQPDNAAVAIAGNPQPSPAQPDQPAAPPPAQTDPSMAAPLPQMEQSNTLRPGAMAPPSVVNQQTISQQLQQMYQQRMQMVQQDRQAAAQGAPANPGK